MTLDANRSRPVTDAAPTVAPPADRWDGALLLGALRAAGGALNRQREAINALNVFPVPDGDTGTNLDLTISAALREAASLGDVADVPASDVAARMARGALLGARGNSGVILSQILRGLAEGIGERAVIDGRDLARALAMASDLAWRAVLKPVEGTMLSVIRAASDGAENALSGDGGPTMPAVLAGALVAARAALAATPEQLDILRQAGVVDAGGQGIVALLAGTLRFAHGRGDVCSLDDEPMPPVAAATVIGDWLGEPHDEGAFGYCTNFLVRGDGLDVDAARARLAGMGQSAVIVGDATTLKVHIHSEHPGTVLEYGLTLGELSEIRIDNMNLQTQALRDARMGASSGTADGAHRDTSIGRQAVLAVASGAGMAEALHSMGATVVVSGGETMNPSTEELLAAVEATDAAEVIVLPNHPNVILAVGQLQQLTERAVRVVPTRSVPQGIAALAAYNAEADLDGNAGAMQRAMNDVRTIQLTTAARDATIDGIDVRCGQAVLLMDGDLVAAGDDGDELLAGAFDDARFAGTELVTIYPGRGATDAQTARARDLVAAALPDADVEVHAGDQPLYTFVISLE